MDERQFNEGVTGNDQIEEEESNMRAAILISDMNKVFKLPPAKWACPKMRAMGYLSLDPVRFEVAMSKLHHCLVPPDGQSMSDWTTEHYGSEAAKLVLRAMSGVPIGPTRKGTGNDNYDKVALENHEKGRAK